MPSLYRQVVWYMRGRSQYTKSGFLNAAKHFQPGDLDVDASNTHFMITGANSGLGKECALEFAKRGATVHMVCRNEERAHQAKQEIEQEASSSSLHVHIVDMANTRAVSEFAHNFVASGHKLDVLINNAGCMIHKRIQTADGFETNFAVNTLAPYLLTTLLLPLLKQSSDPRVINVSSGGMLLHKLNARDPQLEDAAFDGVDAYSQQKRQQVVLSHVWAEQNPWLRSYSMHPGWADTPAVRDALPDFYQRMKDNLRDVHEGADTIIWLALAPNIPDQHNGKFFQDRKPVSEHLPLAFTSSSTADVEAFVDGLGKMAEPYLAPPQ
ncbi:dehydrogenase/reductase SDR family member 12 [Salpingoeca rosetta]|uniref:Dehydrogenase/reductase SDR family member 12 n=1 Tax=Salpingoeca rosetta (strain ATCC 50818 / BSB-021) TaxID=946362 RepID=F2U7A2_SALR5|nr:dehydrogenase/reductase SDR family member 12 [Salpingoeca rosetta]EGD83319.1 dehydrogenase/reductase SDR family member 12 [Salpingoeca rosetta]|eukprot:XP_004994823.1 dehydrogenase/reductase SDR family member 12 [Salpingoeca rosetta]